MKIEKFKSYDVKETQNIGFKFAERLKEGDIVSIEGPLGSGKTEFIRGIADCFEVKEIVSSPTFTFINQYFGIKDENEIIIYHIDLFRIKKMEELEEIGFIECINSQHSIKLVEWPEKANGLLPEFGYKVKIETNQENESMRIITIQLITEVLVN
jgi:tRNA threonylcarbamoyladenosine biosynthesis protein TsaE